MDNPIGRAKAQKNSNHSAEENTVEKGAGTASDQMFGEGLSFAAAESFRLLRTNLSFALPDEKNCRIIGVTSANAGEGKSTTAMNLAYMLAEANKSVILVEADMRLPTISKRWGINSSPGLSNLLAGLNSGREVLRDPGITDGLRLIPSGDIPPNPSELLGSEQMRMTFEVFSQMTDYIIFDLPPINEVSDALVVSRVTDGIVMVVRQNYTSRRSLAAAMRQLEQANTKILGFVMTDADTMNKWGSYKKYKRYHYGRYGYGYGYGYEGGYYGRKVNRGLFRMKRGNAQQDAGGEEKSTQGNTKNTQSPVVPASGTENTPEEKARRRSMRFRTDPDEQQDG